MAVNIKMVHRCLYTIVDAETGKNIINKFFTIDAAKAWLYDRGYTLNRIDMGYHTWRKLV